MLQEINHLRAIAQSCRAGDPLDPRLASWLGSCLDEYLAHKVDDMDEAFGIRSPRGGVQKKNRGRPGMRSMSRATRIVGIHQRTAAATTVRRSEPPTGVLPGPRWGGTVEHRT